MTPRKRAPLLTLGWREWVGLPELGIDSIKAKLDTGALTSSLHAFDLHHFTRNGIEMVRFTIHPVQRTRKIVSIAEARMVDHRKVRTSSGHQELRPVIETQLKVGDQQWPIEITLTRRDSLGFRMLLGRRALRRRVLVDPGRSYQTGRKKKMRSKRPTRTKSQ